MLHFSHRIYLVVARFMRAMTVIGRRVIVRRKSCGVTWVARIRGP
jgi:hypothetical protein